MSYRIEGLPREPFEHLFGLDDQELAAIRIQRMTVDEQPGFPCRFTLDDCAVGERVLLLNHVSHDAANPYRASHAIFVSEDGVPACFENSVPPALDRRVLSLRAFGMDGMMVDAALTQPGEADETIRRLFRDGRTAYIHAHNAVRGCFAAKVERA
jgi:hypothetical protein